LGWIPNDVLTVALTWNTPLATLPDVNSAALQILYMAVPATVVAVLTWNHAVAVLGAANGVLFINLVPITAFTIEAFRGNQPGVGQLIGVAVTLAALVAINVVTRQQAKQPVAPRVPSTEVGRGRELADATAD
jgi:drug/metabolite transporter (DMT)-like permease